MLSNLYLGFKSPKPTAILENSAIGYLKPKAESGFRIFIIMSSFTNHSS
jgi:hypothetical protein